MATIHNGIRAYAFQCTYNSASWIDNPTNLISALQTAINGVTNINSYNQLKISNVRNSVRKELEIEIVGITYKTKTKLNATENDDLITDLQTALDNIANFTYDHINIVNDTFREDPTLSYPGQSMKEE